MVLAIILDGVPESIVIGLGLFEGGKVSLAMLVAVFISNLPEAIAGSTGMKAGGWGRKKIILLWIVIALVCAVSTIAGFSLFSGASDQWLAFIQAFAGGAILMMLANSMIPEAFEHGGKLAGIFTVLGFFVSVSMVILENS
jgi:ZIP family zinc transporter